MKKLFGLLTILCLTLSVALASGADPVKKDVKKNSTEMNKAKADAKANVKAVKADAKADVKTVKADAKKDVQKTTGPLKKDGTPDKRFKENKQAPAAGPLKKDGTPDMRYNSNKNAAKK